MVIFHSFLYVYQRVPYGHQNNDGVPIIATMITDSYS